MLLLKLVPRVQTSNNKIWGIVHRSPPFLCCLASLSITFTVIKKLTQLIAIELITIIGIQVIIVPTCLLTIIIALIIIAVNNALNLIVCINRWGDVTKLDFANFTPQGVRSLS